MGYPFAFFLLLLLISAGAAVLLTTPAERLAQLIRLALPFLLLITGGLLALTGRFGLALPLLFFGAMLWGRNRGVGRLGSARGSKKSTVRSAMFEMELDHDTGQMDGVVLTGQFEGSRLSSLAEKQLLKLLQLTGQDDESAALLEAYLDRRIPGWREHAEADMGSRQGGSSSSGPMTKEEAYQILGLSPGANIREIREAHRRLMKKIHPDSGGSTFLASKINEAKEVLLG